MKRCSRCVLNENFPGISFDSNGVCNFCRDHKPIEEQKRLKDKFENKFIQLIQEHKQNNSYDCLVAYSGGKDSTYTLSLLKEEYGLHILALRYDNWYQSPKSTENINHVVKKLNIDLITVKPNYETFKKIMHTVVTQNIYSMKHMQRASDICTTCISLIRFTCLKTAIEKHIPFVVFGMSPGQAPVITSIVKTNPEMIRNMQDIVKVPVENYIGKNLDSFFLQQRHFKKDKSYPYIINPLSFLRYNEEKIYRVINRLGWNAPKDTDNNSTNCLLNQYANVVHQNKYGFHPYASELSELIRNNILSRGKALSKINDEKQEFLKQYEEEFENNE